MRKRVKNKKQKKSSLEKVPTKYLVKSIITDIKSSLEENAQPPKPKED